MLIERAGRGWRAGATPGLPGAVRAACEDAGTFLIADEIQSGWLTLESCWRWTTKVQADLYTLGKSAGRRNPAGFCCRRAARGARSAAAWRARIDVRW